MTSAHTFPLWRNAFSLFVVLFLGLLSPFAVFRVPVIALWKPAVALIEWGWLVACLLLLAAFMGDLSSWLGRCALVVACIGVVFVLSPVVRAYRMSPVVAGQIRTTLGESSYGGSVSSTRKPFSVLGLFGTSHAATEQKRYDVPIGQGRTLPLDLYQKVGVEGKRPLVVMIHGGSWQGGDLEQLSGVNRYIASLGVHVAALSYRLSPAHQFPVHLDDIRTMLLWLRQESGRLGIDANQIIVAGRSAGGHLALLAGLQRVVPGIRGVISLYGPSDLHWSWANPSSPWILDSPQLLRAFLGGAPSEVKYRYDQASPILKVAASSPPVLLIHGSRDELVSPIQSRRLAKVLSEKGVLHYVLELPWATHGCDANLSGPSGQMMRFAIERFLGRVLSLKRGGR